MDIIVPHTIKKRELGGTISDEARKLFAEIKERPEIAASISSPRLPARTTLHKVYATTSGGPRRLLFFCRQASGTATSRIERWVLLFYRDKSDRIGNNMSPKNPDFTQQLAKNLQAAMDDLANSTPEHPRYDVL